MTSFSKALPILAVSAILLVGCGGPAPTAADPGPQTGKEVVRPAKKAEMGKGGSLADDKAVPAPAGVKTGTPGK